MGGKDSGGLLKPLWAGVLIFASPDPDGLRGDKVANNGLTCSTPGVTAGEPVRDCEMMMMTGLM